jgi:hypothetical protein
MCPFEFTATPGDLSEIHPLWELEEVGHRIERQLGRALLLRTMVRLISRTVNASHRRFIRASAGAHYRLYNLA